MADLPVLQDDGPDAPPSASAVASPIYPRFARSLHWINAAIVAILLVTAVWADQLEQGAMRGALYTLHVGTAVLAIPLLFARVGNSMIGGSLPAPEGTPQWQAMLAGLVHKALLLLLLWQPLTGVAMYVIEGESITPFGLFVIPGVADPVPVVASALRFAHEAGAVALYVALALHLAGAASHIAKRDGVIRRMIG